MTGDAYDLSVVNKKGRGDGGVPHGKTLITFVEAVLGDDEAALQHSRQEMMDTLGPEGLVDSAAIVAAFNKMDRIANATGISLDGMLDVVTVGMRAEIGIDRFVSAANTPPAGYLKRLLSGAMKPVAPVGMKLLRSMQRRRSEP